MSISTWFWNPGQGWRSKPAWPRCSPVRVSFNPRSERTLSQKIKNKKLKMENNWRNYLVVNLGPPHEFTQKNTPAHMHTHTHTEEEEENEEGGTKKRRKIDNEKEKSGETTLIPSDQDSTLWLIASLEASLPQTPMLEFRVSTNEFHTEGHSVHSSPWEHKACLVLFIIFPSIKQRPWH